MPGSEYGSALGLEVDLDVTDLRFIWILIFTNHPNSLSFGLCVCFYMMVFTVGASLPETYHRYLFLFTNTHDSLIPPL